MTKPGKYKNRIEIYSVAVVPDGEGGYESPQYILVGYRYASVTQISESESFRSGLNLGEVNYRIKFHKGQQEEFSRTWQIKHGNKMLNVTGVTSTDYEFTITASEMDRFPGTESDNTEVTVDNQNYKADGEANN